MIAEVLTAFLRLGRCMISTQPQKKKKKTKTKHTHTHTHTRTNQKKGGKKPAERSVSFRFGLESLGHKSDNSPDPTEMAVSFFRSQVRLTFLVPHGRYIDFSKSKRSIGKSQATAEDTHTHTHTHTHAHAHTHTCNLILRALGNS